jgi:hypothetical protein
VGATWFNHAPADDFDRAWLSALSVLEGGIDARASTFTRSRCRMSRLTLARAIVEQSAAPARNARRVRHGRCARASYLLKRTAVDQTRASGARSRCFRASAGDTIAAEASPALAVSSSA